MGTFMQTLQHISEQQLLTCSTHFLECLFADTSDLDLKLENNAILNIVTRICSGKKDISKLSQNLQENTCDNSVSVS